MKDQDSIQRFLFNSNVRGEIVHLDLTFQKIIQQHHYESNIANLLGEMLAAVSLLSATIKFKGRLSLQFQGKDPLKMALVQSDHEFHLRGLAQSSSSMTTEELKTILKEGVLAIIITPENLGQRYQGLVSWQGNNLAHSLEGYFKDSEQLPTRIWLAVDETRAAGLLLQAIPSVEDLERKDWVKITTVAEKLTPAELLTLDHQTLLTHLFPEEDIRLFDAAKTAFRCTCSIQKSENAILMVGEKEIEQELKEKNHVAVTCDFCNREYLFNRDEIAAIFNKGDYPQQLH